MTTFDLLFSFLEIMLWLHIVLGVNISRDPLLQKAYCDGRRNSPKIPRDQYSRGCRTFFDIPYLHLYRVLLCIRRRRVFSGRQLSGDVSLYFRRWYVRSLPNLMRPTAQKFGSSETTGQVVWRIACHTHFLCRTSSCILYHYQHSFLKLRSRSNWFQ